MPAMTSYPSGTPSWADLLAHDGQKAKDFYTGLLGWTYEDHPVDGTMVYTMYSHQGQAVCASAERGPGQENLPPHWSVYVTVDDLEAALERARNAGGTVIAEPFDVLEVGRMAIIQDPQGAYLRLWFPKGHAGASVMMEPGALCWFELATNDTEGAQAFYSALLQLDAIPDPDAAFPYTLLTRGEQHVAGIMEIGADWGPVPPNWGVYFGVNDVEATVAKAQELGGGVVVAPMDIADFARFAVLRDSEGAVFSVIKLNAW